MFGNIMFYEFEISIFQKSPHVSIPSKPTCPLRNSANWPASYSLKKELHMARAIIPPSAAINSRAGSQKEADWG